MPHKILKRVIDYCFYSKTYFIFIVILLFISSLFQNYVVSYADYPIVALLHISVFVSLSGYGMLITRSRIRHGVRLPKIEIKKIIVFGVKSSIVMAIYFYIQTFILKYIGCFFDFPAFDLKDLLLNLSDTLVMFYYHNPVDTLIFVIVGAILFYVTTFFMEIALAKLADTNSILSSFNLISIKKSIDVIGWRNYAKEYTMIILVIVVLSYVISHNLPFEFLDSIVDMILSFIIFVTQYLGMGAIYCKIKDLESGMS